MLDAAKADVALSRLAGTTPAGDPTAATADAWRSAQRPKLTAPIRPKVKGPFVAAYSVNPKALPASASAAPSEAATPMQAVPAPPVAVAASPAKLPGGYTAQELLEIYQRYQKPGAAPAAKPSADSNS